MWYLPDQTNTYAANVNPNLWKQNSNICAKSTTMLTYINELTQKNTNDNLSLIKRCCQPAPYFTNKPINNKS